MVPSSSRALFWSAAILLHFISFAGASGYKTYRLANNYVRVFDGMGRDPYGHVYIGAGSTTTYDAALFQYDAHRDTLRIVSKAKTASQTANNWQTSDKPGKIHSKIHYSPDGKMYFATHSSDEGSDYSGFRGGHLYSFNIASGETKDESAPEVFIAHNGVLDCPVAPAFNLVYGVGYPDGDLYAHDLTTGISNLIGPSGSREGGVSRYMFTDNVGRLFYPKTTYFYCYNPSTKTASYKAIGKINGVSQISCLVKTLSGDTIYFIPHGKYNIYEYIPSLDKVTDLGLANTDSSDTPVRGLAMRWDLNKLYYAPDLLGALVEFDIPTRTKKVIDAAPRQMFTGSDGVDKNGDIFFVCYGTCGTVYKFILDTPCTVCSTAVTAVEAPVRVSSESFSLNVRPSPFIAPGNIHIALPAQDSYTLSIYNTGGRLIRAWRNEAMPQGPDAVVKWDGRDLNGMPVVSGVYLVRAAAGNRVVSKALTFVH